MKKKRIIIFSIILLAMLCMIITITLILYHKREKITFYINGKEASELSKEIEYQDDIDYSVKAIKLTAKKQEKEITNKIQVKKIKIDKLKTYHIKYELEHEQFIYKMKVIDKSAPIITGENMLIINQNETFDQALLNLKAFDNFDKDLTANISCEGSVDTTMPGSYELIFKVSDSSKNSTELKATITVKELVKDNQNNSSYDTDVKNDIVNNPDDIGVLINKQYKLPDGWSPNDLVSIGNNHYLRAEAATSLNQMRQDAINSGIPLNVVSSYRSQAYQTNLYNNYYANDPANAPYYSAYPRTSEHELGLAVDISYDYALHDDLQNSALGQWMAVHAHEYGWIMRYPYGKSDFTGYIFEAWHYRYVGVSLATNIHNNNLTMEEYYY